MNEFLTNLGGFFKGSSEAKVSVGLDTTMMLKAGIIVIVTVALSTLLIKILK